MGRRGCGESVKRKQLHQVRPGRGAVPEGGRLVTSALQRVHADRKHLRRHLMYLQRFQLDNDELQQR